MGAGRAFVGRISEQLQICHGGVGAKHLDEILEYVFGKLFPGLSKEAWPNSANLNLYRDGRQGVGWHADDELLFKGKDSDCPVVSISLGAAREFWIALKDGTAGDPPRRSGAGDLGAPKKELRGRFLLGQMQRGAVKQLLEVLADVQALRQTNEKLDMILTARLGGPVYSACELETSPVRAPLEAVVEEADADGEIAKEDRLPETSVTAPRFGADAAPAEPPGEWSPEDEGIAPPRDGLASFPSFQVEASFPEESQEQEPEPPMSHKDAGYWDSSGGNAQDIADGH
eukprot:s5029_g2.t2